MADVQLRRTQAERRASTRRALLDATFHSLIDDGYAATTTTAVAQRAGVSIGALQHHFPTKADLVAAALADVYERRQAEFASAFTSLAPTADRVDSAIDLLWEMFRGPTFAAWAELWIAARTDATLASVLAPVQAQFTETCRALFASLFEDVPSAADPANRDLALAFAFAVLDGVAMSGLLGASVSPHAQPQTVIDALKFVSHLLLPRQV